MTKLNFNILVRVLCLIFAVLTTIAVITQFRQSFILTGNPLGNFLSYFTIQSNLFASVVLYNEISYRKILVWLIYPIVWLIYTMIRGLIIDWNPYPFLEPSQPGGYLAVTLYSVGIAITFMVFSWLLVIIGSRMSA